LQLGTTIRRWDTSTWTDTVVWDPFDFLDPLTERTNSTNSDPGINSDSRSPMPCAGATLSIEEWTHSNSLQVAPTGELLQSIRHLDTVVAIAPQFDRIVWRIGRFRSDFAFPNPSDRFYHQHHVRLLDNGNLLLFDNGNGRPAAEGGLYSRALELALDWESMTVTNVWEYRHAISSQDGSTSYKYTNATGSAERLQNGNTLVSFGTDIDPRTQLGRTPQTFTLVEADASREASAVAVLDMQIPGEPILYRALPVTSLFGEVPGKSHD
jgi:Arylsulfotransferase (ASST)